MDEKTAMMLASAVKDIMIRAMEMALEIESATGLKVVTREYLETLYEETMRQRSWQ